MALTLRRNKEIKQSRPFNRTFYMHKLNIQHLGFFLLMIMGISSGCDSCPENFEEVVGDEFFTLEFGANSSFNPGELLLYVDLSGGEDPTPDLELLEPPLEGSKIGPISFTERFINPISTEINGIGLENTRHAYNYHIRRNNSSDEDILRVEFFLEAGSCETEWTYIRYFLNAQLLEDLTNRQQVNIVVP